MAVAPIDPTGGAPGLGKRAAALTPACLSATFYASLAPWRFISNAATLASVVSCANPPLLLTPSAAPATVCPIGGCSPSKPLRASPTKLACPAAGDAPCAGFPATDCRERALTAWSGAQDDGAVACVGRMLGEACSLGDAPACAFAGRLWLDGRGMANDVERGLGMIERACDSGVALACLVGVRWLSDPLHARDVHEAEDLRTRLGSQHACLTGEAEECYGVGLLYYFGRSGYPLDKRLAAGAYERGCDLGDPHACNNLGDALAYGDGVERDLVRSSAMFDKACRLGEPLGCANSGYMFEHGEGVVRDVARARGLYRTACVNGDVYGCLHGEMLAAQDTMGSPRPERAFAAWRRACASGNARACAFVGVIYEDGPDGLTRDSEKSLEAMNRACALRSERACEWIKAHPGP